MRSERTGLEVMTEWPKSPVSTRLQVEEISLRHRSIEPDFQAERDHRPAASRRIADDGQHGVDRDESSNREGDGGQPEKGRDQGTDKAQDPHESRVRLLSARARRSRATASRSWPQLAGALSRTARRMRERAP